MPSIVPVLIALFAGAILTICYQRWDETLTTRKRPASSPSAPVMDRRLMASDDYWAGLAAGARFAGTYRSPDEIDTCVEGMIVDQRVGSQAERDFATGWLRSVRHMRGRMALVA